MNKNLMFSSETDQWSTPQDFFDSLDEEFHFTLDVCADESNHKCALYYDKQLDGLRQNWSGHTVYCNPPYGMAIGDWVEKCFREVYSGSCKCAVMLLPARLTQNGFIPTSTTRQRFDSCVAG